MSIKNKLLIIHIFLISLSIEGNLYALFGNDDSEEWILSTFVRKYFSCCMRRQPLQKDKQDFHSEENRSLLDVKLSKIEQFPLEITYLICFYLSPIEIVHLSMTSKNFNIKIDNWFWESHIKNYSLTKWDPTVAPIKVACAYSFFEQGKIEKAASIGLPKAIKLLKSKQDKEKEAARKEVNSLFSSSLPYIYDRKLWCGSPLLYRGTYY